MNLCEMRDRARSGLAWPAVCRQKRRRGEVVEKAWWRQVSSCCAPCGEGADARSLCSADACELGADQVDEGMHRFGKDAPGKCMELNGEWFQRAVLERDCHQLVIFKMAL